MNRILLAASALAAFAQTSPLPPGQPVVATPSPTPPAAEPVPVGRSKPPATTGHRRKPSPAEIRVRAANAKATREPAGLAFVNAVQVYPYAAGVLYRLFAAPERVTDIAL